MFPKMADEKNFLIACRYLYSKLGAWIYFYISEFTFQCLPAGVSSLKIFIWPNGESMVNVDLLYHFCAMSFYSVKKWKFLSKTFKVFDYKNQLQYICIIAVIPIIRILTVLDLAPPLTLIISLGIVQVSNNDIKF